MKFSIKDKMTAIDKRDVSVSFHKIFVIFQLQNLYNKNVYGHDY